MQYLGTVVEAGLIPSLKELALKDFSNLTTMTEAGVPGVVESGGNEVQNMISKINYATVSSRVVFHLLASSFSKLVEEVSSSSPSSKAAATLSVIDHVLTLVHSFLSQWLPCVLMPNARIANSNNSINAFNIHQRTLPKILRKPMEELLHVHSEMIVDLQHYHPIAFVRYLDPFLKCFHYLLMKTVGGVGSDELSTVASLRERRVSSSVTIRRSNRFVIALLSFLANVAGTSDYTPTEATKEPSFTDNTSEIAAGSAATIVWSNFFTPSLILSLSRSLLHLFSYHIHTNTWNSVGKSSNDDENDDVDDEVQWQEDPEGFYHWEIQRSSEDDVGCAAQNVFLSLVESSFFSGANYYGGKEVILPWLIGLLSNVASQRLAVEIEGGASFQWDAHAIISSMPLGSNNLQTMERNSTTQTPTQLEIEQELILQWDAVYTAAGLACNILESCPGFEFRAWFDACLGPCLGLLSQCRSNQVKTKECSQGRVCFLV